MRTKADLAAAEKTLAQIVADNPEGKAALDMLLAELIYRGHNTDLILEFDKQLDSLNIKLLDQIRDAIQSADHLARAVSFEADCGVSDPGYALFLAKKLVDAYKDMRDQIEAACDTNFEEERAASRRFDAAVARMNATENSSSTAHVYAAD